MHAILILLAFLAAPKSTLTGRVVAPNGRPVANGVVVTQKFNALGGYGNVEVKTDAYGRFSAIAGGKVVYVRKAGFVPFTRKLQPGDDNLHIVLEPISARTTFTIPPCKEKYGLDGKAAYDPSHWPKGARFAGMEHHLYPVPGQARVEDHTDADSGVHVISFPENSQDRLLIRWGFPWSNPYPDLYLFDNAVGFTERALSTGEPTEEIRGTLTNGHKFRWVGGDAGDISYHDVTPETAALFDRIIDGGCFTPWP